jgi:hypothetical protein
MKDHTRRLNTAKKAADLLYGDTSVTPAETMLSLKDLAEHVSVLIDSVAEDLGMQEEP